MFMMLYVHTTVLTFCILLCNDMFDLILTTDMTDITGD